MNINIHVVAVISKYCGIYVLEVLQKVRRNVLEEKILNETRKYEKLQYIVKYKHDQDTISTGCQNDETQVVHGAL